MDKIVSAGTTCCVKEDLRVSKYDAVGQDLIRLISMDYGPKNGKTWETGDL